MNKTKICIFEKRKKKRNVTWTINGHNIEIVDKFCYLGINMFYNGNMSHAIKYLTEQASKAVSNLFYIFQRLNFDISMKLQLFDRMVTPILTYCSEIWGVYNLQEIDRIHIKFCKSILGVKSQTQNMAVLGELGRYSLSTICKERALKYFIKIKRNPDSLMCKLLNDQITLNRNGITWATEIKNIIDNLGFSHTWNNFDINVDYLPIFKQRLRDQFIQEWQIVINNSTKLESYCRYKTEFKLEPYLVNITNDYQRKLLCRFRLSSHNLEIEAGRYTGKSRNNRICKCCNANVIESEFHFLLICPMYRSIRLAHLGNVNWPTVDKFVRFMKTEKHAKLKNIAIYLKKSFKVREQYINSI